MSASLVWDANPTIEKIVGYRVYRSSMPNSIKIGKTSENFVTEITSTSYQLPPISSIGDCYAVTAFNSWSESLPTAEICIINPTAPKNFRVVSIP